MDMVSLGHNELKQSAYIMHQLAHIFSRMLLIIVKKSSFYGISVVSSNNGIW